VISNLHIVVELLLASSAHCSSCKALYLSPAFLQFCNDVHIFSAAPSKPYQHDKYEIIEKLPEAVYNTQKTQEKATIYSSSTIVLYPT
jgi:hypothetical protein